ncbi:MAG: hypothetical protein JW750_02065 [Anaerolineaceae bacterium]|nr:hypothetical protein [Anaerolineaceae bacterium]
MRLYKLFSPQHYHQNHPGFEKRRNFFDQLRLEQEKRDYYFLSRQLGYTCPCCGYPVRNILRDRTICPICGLEDQRENGKDVQIELYDLRRVFERRLVARPLVERQQWVGWDTQVDLMLHRIIAAGFDSMVDEEDFYLIDHALVFCHQLLSYATFRMDVGTRLLELHQADLEEHSRGELFSFNEREIEKTFFEYVEADGWDYLQYFLNPSHIVRAAPSEETAMLTCRVAGTSYLSREDWIYCYANLELGDPLTLKPEPDNVNDHNAVLVLDFTGKKLGYIERDCAQRISQTIQSGTRCYGIVQEVANENGHLRIMMDIHHY